MSSVRTRYPAQEKLSFTALFTPLPDLRALPASRSMREDLSVSRERHHLLHRRSDLVLPHRAVELGHLFCQVPADAPLDQPVDLRPTCEVLERATHPLRRDPLLQLEMRAQVRHARRLPSPAAHASARRCSCGGRPAPDPASRVCCGSPCRRRPLRLSLASWTCRRS